MASMVSDVPANVDVLAKQCVETGAAGHVQALLAGAEAAGIVFSQTINCKQIVTSPVNRGGDGVDSFDVQENVSDVANTKFHKNLFSGLLSDIDHSDFDAVIKFNEKMVASSNGRLAKVEPRTSTHITLWGRAFDPGDASCACKVLTCTAFNDLKYELLSAL